MKKLTAGIFATILGLTTVNAFAANQNGVASTQYVRGAMAQATTNAVDQVKAIGYLTEHQSLDAYAKTETVNAALGTKADKSVVDGHTADIQALQGETSALTSSKQDKLGTANFYVDPTKATGNVVTKITADNGVVTYETGTVATTEGLEALTTTVSGHTTTIGEQATVIGGLTTDLGNLQTKVGQLETGLGEVESSLGDKENTLTGAKLDAVSSGITATKVQKYDAYEQSIAGAVSDAAQAKTDAATAVSDAATAKTDAATAVADAAKAQTDAASAISTANSAASKAEQAETTAGDAYTAATKASSDVTALTTTVNSNSSAITALQNAGHITNAQRNSALAEATAGSVVTGVSMSAGVLSVESSAKLGEAAYMDVVDEYVPAGTASM